MSPAEESRPGLPVSHDDMPGRGADAGSSPWGHPFHALAAFCGFFVLSSLWLAHSTSRASVPREASQFLPSLPSLGDPGSTLDAGSVLGSRAADGACPPPTTCICDDPGASADAAARSQGLLQEEESRPAAGPRTKAEAKERSRVQAQLDREASALLEFDDVRDSDWPWLQEKMAVDVSGEEEQETRAQIGSTAEWLLREWAQSSMLRGRKGANLSHAGTPLPPHLEDCLGLEQLRRQLDERGPDGSWPPWSLYGGTSGLELGLSAEEAAPQELLGQAPREAAAGAQTQEDLPEELLGTRPSSTVLGPLPPWVAGADEDNLVLTRRVQRDLWLLQHPRDCFAPGVQFYVVNVTTPNFNGVGSYLQASACLLGEAVKLKRVLVISYHVKADHDLCKGPLRGSWACYFARETSPACHARAMQALKKGRTVLQGAPGWQDATFVKRESLHWLCKAPNQWGTPWRHIHPSVQVHGAVFRRADDDSHRWFRAQAVRYLMRYPSTRLCLLTNRARHAAFGRDAAVLVARSLVHRQANNVSLRLGLEHPLKPFWDRGELFRGAGRMISVHVRQGDKKREMVIHPFSDHMALAETVRDRFPEAASVWLSTEMHSVVEKSRQYKGWRFYFTNVTRQGQYNESMADYEGDLGLGLSTDNSFVNLLISTGADFFVGTMGSTWSVIIDDMRRTSGKEPRGLLSVNRDRFWMTTEERNRIYFGNK